MLQGVTRVFSLQVTVIVSCYVFVLWDINKQNSSEPFCLHQTDLLPYGRLHLSVRSFVRTLQSLSSFSLYRGILGTLNTFFFFFFKGIFGVLLAFMDSFWFTAFLHGAPLSPQTHTVLHTWTLRWLLAAALQTPFCSFFCQLMSDLQLE